MSEVVSDRFDLKHCIENRAGRLVCQAYDRVENRDVALKVERKRGVNNEKGITSLEREAIIGRVLPVHANVLTLYDLYYLPGVDGQTLVVLAMEYADGGSLREWLRQQTVWDRKARAAGWDHFRSLCMGVIALHAQGVSSTWTSSRRISCCALEWSKLLTSARPPSASLC